MTTALAESYRHTCTDPQWRCIMHAPVGRVHYAPTSALPGKVAAVMIELVGQREGGEGDSGGGGG